MKRILLVLFACLVPALARAQTIDLTTVGATFFGADGARWYQGTTFAGTTSFVGFLRVQATPTERGFNTDFRPLVEDDIGTLTFTHSITFGVFQPRILTDATGAYRFYTLLLDVNESSTNGDNYISLDSLTVYSVPAGSGGSLSTRAAIAAAGTVRYDMDQPANQVVLIDGNLVVGSGLNDIEIDIPASRFDGVGASDFIYVLVHFGQLGTVSTRKYGTSGGFEELRYSQTVTDVEEASSAATGPWIRMMGAPSGALRAHYYVPGAGQVRLTLYDIHGRAVASTSFREDAGGMRDLPLHTAPSVSRLASGIYFYRFEWNDTRRSGKVAILR
ncbi:MAG TPA: T9SS type A sorting domain-containing protein [Candidatus Eisenbacteria bacterium]|nr:T9SS type A sorting domain-containing protein [Candidatus Eisenbacteria bacterium]